jgi:hypothetical protein
MTQHTPRIGCTLDYEEGGGYSRYPWYALRDHYSAAVARFGGIPFALPHEVAYVPQYLDTLDGLAKVDRVPMSNQLVAQGPADSGEVDNAGVGYMNGRDPGAMRLDVAQLSWADFANFR